MPSNGGPTQLRLAQVQDLVAELSSKSMGSHTHQDHFRIGYTSVSDNHCWDDLRFPATSINPAGAADVPGIDNDVGGLLFDATREEVQSCIVQMPHGWKEGSTLYPHFHWQKTTTNSGNVVWKVNYRWSPVGAVMDANWTVLSNHLPSSNTPGNGQVGYHYITDVGTISGEGKHVSDCLIIQYSRDAPNVLDTFTADARLLEFDLHYEMDSIGSDQITSKTV